MSISEFPTNRGWDLERVYDPDSEGARYQLCARGWVPPGRRPSSTRRSSGISPREALAMDPQQRLLLEALLGGVRKRGHRSRSRCKEAGLGCSRVMHLPRGDGWSCRRLPVWWRSRWVTGDTGSVVSGRVAYMFGLEGPTMTVDTACSSSLVALHLACGALRTGECSLALAGGVTVLAHAETVRGVRASAGVWRRDGRCKSFADTADGTGWGEGVGVLVLERLLGRERQRSPRAGGGAG